MHEVVSGTVERVEAAAMDSLWWRERGDCSDDCGTMIGFLSESGEMSAIYRDLTIDGVWTMVLGLTDKLD
jgi:hypothetical protein